MSCATTLFSIRQEEESSKFDYLLDPNVGSLNSCSASPILAHRRVANCVKKRSEDSKLEDMGQAMRHDHPNCYSKTLASTAGCSYDYTYSSRYRHREDGYNMPPGASVESLRIRLHAIWYTGEPVAIRRLRRPPGYNNFPAKRPRIDH